MQADIDLKTWPVSRARLATPLLVLLGALAAPYAKAATIVAASCALADVQTAINAANDGDVVKIPNGSCAWSGGISTSKQILVQAQNYTATPRGTMTRSVTITHNAGTTPLIQMTSGNSYHIGVGGIRFNDGTGSGNYLRFSGSGSKIPLVYDCAFQIPKEGGNNPTNSKIAMLNQGGVLWNIYFQGLGDPNQINMSPIFLDAPRAWTTASTMGQLDSNGTVNFYLEDSTAKDVDALVDVDQRSRAVVRSNLLDGTWLLTHGFTSGMYAGGRHVEFYDNTLRVTTRSRNMSGRYFWLRAGTAVVTGNDAARADDTQSYAGGSVGILSIGDNTAPNGTDGPMQPGWGHNGAADVRDPIYVWGNTGAMGSSVGFNNSSGNWAGVTGSNELIVNQGAKPGWSRFTYPHPARSAVVNDVVVRPNSPAGVTVN